MLSSRSNDSTPRSPFNPAAGGNVDRFIAKKPSSVARLLLLAFGISAAVAARAQNVQAVTGLGPSPTAVLENAHTKISFFPGKTKDKPAVLQHIDVRSGDGWQSLETSPMGDSYQVIYRSTDSDLKMRTHDPLNPSWTPAYQSPEWDTTYAPMAGGVVKQDAAGGHAGFTTTPWLAGECFSLRPVHAKQVDKHTVLLEFEPLKIGTFTAVWHLEKDLPEASVTLSLALNKAGYVSLAYHGAVVSPVNDLDFLMLPYLYLGHRFPEKPGLTTEDKAPMPAALMTLHGISYAVMADPDRIPFAWPNSGHFHYGLGVRNEEGNAEALVYSPVLGGDGSLRSQPGAVVSSFRVWVEKSDWTQSYSDISSRVFNLTDYRRPVQASLSDAALNLYDLLKNDAVNGWDVRSKGPWDIESRNHVRQASPLTYLSYYELTGDEEFYRKYALPSLEYLLSRPAVNFSVQTSQDHKTTLDAPLGGPVSGYSATLYAGAYEMTQGRSPIFGYYSLDHSGKVRTLAGDHHAAFEDALALYQLTGEKHWLDAAETGADRYIAENLTVLPSKDLGTMPFVNVSSVPAWESLLHLYEATKEPRYLKAAHDGAYWLITTLWVQPRIPNGDFTVHPHGLYDGGPLVWWKGDRRFRLGIYDAPAKADSTWPKVPPTPVPAVSVPAWDVSNVGLGLEQPVTYSVVGNEWNILMSTWAPNLLRLASYTNDPLFKTAARNATIGRFANYPGYYANLFTNLDESPTYPINGPDVTTIYLHHIPAFSAYVLDYLFTDAEMRSHGEITFPSVRGDGYVWFDNRIRGFAPGKVYGESAWPWINRTAAALDNKNVDEVLAHSEGTLYVTLINQVYEAQHVQVHLDSHVLGSLEKVARARTWVDNKKGKQLAVNNGIIDVNLPAGGLVTLAVDGLQIHVSTHTVAPPSVLPLPTNSGLETKNVEGSALQAVATFISVPPFRSREFYVYVRANRAQCSGATLIYKDGAEPEKQLRVDGFPCEFSVPLPATNDTVQWRIVDVKKSTPVSSS